MRVSEPTKKLIKNHLLTPCPDRFTVSEIREYIERQFERINRAGAISTASLQRDDQVVPDIDNQPAKLICQDPPLPKFELSTENMSMVLKMMSPSSQQEQNKMFLKPSLLAERCNRISVSPSNSPSGNVGVTRNLTRQINNLSVRNRQHTNPGLSWHQRISNSALTRWDFEQLNPQLWQIAQECSRGRWVHLAHLHISMQSTTHSTICSVTEAFLRTESFTSFRETSIRISHWSCQFGCERISTTIHWWGKFISHQLTVLETTSRSLLNF